MKMKILFLLLFVLKLATTTTSFAIEKQESIYEAYIDQPLLQAV